VNQLVQRATDAFNAAQAALAAGNLGEYQRQVALIGPLLAQAQKVANGTAATTTPPTTRATPST
jgi:hypothetical protein